MGSRFTTALSILQSNSVRVVNSLYAFAFPKIQQSFLRAEIRACRAYRARRWWSPRQSRSRRLWCRH